MSGKLMQLLSLLGFMFFSTFKILFSAQVNFSQEPEVRVRILKTTEPIKIKFNGEWEVNGTNINTNIGNQSILEFKIVDNLLSITSNDKSISAGSDIIKLSTIDTVNSIDVFDVPYGVGWWWEGKEDRNYSGKVLLHKTDDNNIEVIITLPIENYLMGVIPYEIGGDSPLEALKAQAVAARSEAFVALSSGLYGGKLHDLTADVECQVFSGNKKRTINSDKAVTETRGIVLTENDEIINAFYSSNCGGHSELIKNVWPDRSEKESYKVSGKDWIDDDGVDLSDEQLVRNWILTHPESFCNPEGNNVFPSWSKNNYRWEVNYSSEEISKMLGSERLGLLLEIVPIKRGTSGRISKAKFIYEKDEVIIEGELKIRLLFTPPLKSSCFIVDKDVNGFHIKGAGWGHGVGMCQSGAVAMALENKSFEEILRHYYKKANQTVVYK